MLQQFLDHFLTNVPLQLPELLDKGEMKQPVYHDDMVELTFPLVSSYDLEDIMDMFEDDMELILLYHHIPSRHSEFSHSACAYSNPDFGQMFKIVAVTNADGKVHEVTVTVFCDMEYMCSDICQDLKIHEERGHMQYSRTKDEVLLNFM